VLTAVDASGVAHELGRDGRDACVRAFSKQLRTSYPLATTVNALAPFGWWSERGLVVGGVTIAVPDEKTVLSDHACLGSWASAWGERPRLEAFDLAKGRVTRDSPECSIVEVHNRADGDCLLQAIGFYLCVSRPGWSATVDEMRKLTLDHVEARLKNNAPAFDRDRDTARAAGATTEENELWAAERSTKAGEALAKYVFTRRRSGADLGNLEIDALSRVYKTDICVWSTPNGGVNLLYKTSPHAVRDHNGPIADFGTRAHLRYYATGHYTLLALLEGGRTDFGRLRRYV
jgi:hypothetical protein